MAPGRQLTRESASTTVLSSGPESGTFGNANLNVETNMERWVVFALISMLFAGITAVIAKHGLQGISGDLGLAVRTCYVAALVLGYTVFIVPREQIGLLSRHNHLWLGLSGLTTAVSWVFYYKALKDGEVSTVALIDKGSFVVAVVLAWLLLGERLTPRIITGGLLIVAGLWVVSRK